MPLCYQRYHLVIALYHQTDALAIAVINVISRAEHWYILWFIIFHCWNSETCNFTEIKIVFLLTFNLISKLVNVIHSKDIPTCGLTGILKIGTLHYHALVQNSFKNSFENNWCASQCPKFISDENTKNCSKPEQKQNFHIFWRNWITVVVRFMNTSFREFQEDIFIWIIYQNLFFWFPKTNVRML